MVVPVENLERLKNLLIFTVLAQHVWGGRVYPSQHRDPTGKVLTPFPPLEDTALA